MQPFDFSRLIFTAIIAYFAFDEKLDFTMLVGAIVILIGSLIAISKKTFAYPDLIIGIFLSYLTLN